MSKQIPQNYWILFEDGLWIGLFTELSGCEWMMKRRLNDPKRKGCQYVAVRYKYGESQTLQAGTDEENSILPPSF